MRRARWKRKNVSAGRAAYMRPSCRRRGMVGTPAQKSGTETPGPWGSLWPGEVQGYPLLLFPLPLTLPRRTRQRLAKRKARKEKLVKYDLATHRSQQYWHGSAVAILQKILACPKVRQNRRLHRYADPRQRGGPLHRSASKRFFSSTGRGAFSFWRCQKENGGRTPCGSSLSRGEDSPPQCPQRLTAGFSVLPSR